MRIYRGTDGDIKPVECDCDKFGFPSMCIPVNEKEERQYGVI